MRFFAATSANLLKYCIYTFIVVIFIAAPINAAVTPNNQQDGAMSEEEIRKKFLPLSLEDAKTLAIKGDPQAQYQMGFRYLLGVDVEESEHEAKKWFLKAAEQENAWAQLSLANIYLFSDKLPRDINQGKKWLEKSAANGDPTAKSLLPLIQKDYPY